MQLKQWRPGTSRWAYLLTGIYVVLWPVGLAFAIAEGQESGWVSFALATITMASSLTLAYQLQRRGRH
jgi:hypothetical protein